MFQPSEVKTANIHSLPNAMHKKKYLNKGVFILPLIVVLSIACFCSFLLFQFANLSSAKAKNTLTKEEVLSLVNFQRKSQNLKTLKANGLLNLAAQKKAADMAANQYFSHYRPSDKKRGLTFIQEVGYKYITAGENLAVYYDNGTELVTDWMSSPTHRANILNKNFTETGIGISTGKYQGYQTYFVVQFFTSGSSNSNYNSGSKSSSQTKRSAINLQSKDIKSSISSKKSSEKTQSESSEKSKLQEVGIDLSTQTSNSEELPVNDEVLEDTIDNVSQIFENQFDEIDEN